MANVEKKYHRSDLARQQLKTAVSLLLHEKDLSSIITLSAASSNILSQLVRNEGKEPFIDYARRVHDATIGSTPSRTKYKHYIDNALGINVHKHMSPLCPKTCILDLHQCAVDSLTAAIGDYVTLYGQKDDFVSAYLSWRWVRQDGKELIALCNNMPEKLKKTEKWNSKIELGKYEKKIGIKREKIEKKTYQRFQLAANQLKTAIVLFMTGIDRLSAITLAGAADVILCELVNREGKKNFTDLMCEKENREHKRKTGNEINNLLYINALKHFDKGDEEYIELDVEECALGAISKALANYNMLNGKDDKLILAFRYWAQTNLDLKKYNIDSELNVS